jgi:hypothetical protein
VVFSPTLIWNAQHGWASVLYQFHRLVVDEWSLRYFGEFFVTQMGLATPPVFILGVMGLVAMLRGEGGRLGARVLLNAMVWPIVFYFVWHTFHGRVEGNWPEPVYAAFVIAAAVAAELIKWDGAWANIARWSRRLAVPVGLVIAACLYLQAVFAIVPLGPVDPTARALGAGWKELGVQLDDVRQKLGAPIVLTRNYGLTSWLSFYLPSHPPVAQINERLWWVNSPEPDPALFAGTMMYVCIVNCDELPLVRQRFATVEPVTKLARTRRGVPIQEYAVYRLSGPIGPPLDPP